MVPSRNYKLANYSTGFVINYLGISILPIGLSRYIKMIYGQVMINPKHRRLQQILWCTNFDEPIKTYEPKRVTYGTTTGSFLTLRCLHEVANECEDMFDVVSLSEMICMLMTF